VPAHSADKFRASKSLKMIGCEWFRMIGCAFTSMRLRGSALYLNGARICRVSTFLICPGLDEPTTVRYAIRAGTSLVNNV